MLRGDAGWVNNLPRISLLPARRTPTIGSAGFFWPMGAKRPLPAITKKIRFLPLPARGKIAACC